MSSITIDNDELKAFLKQALIELLEEKNQALYDALVEAIEDVCLVKAIQEGQASPMVDGTKVLETLEQNPEIQGSGEP